jgi:AraC-like DNA-binding protein
MAKKRVHEIARERGMSSKDVIATLQKAGLDVKAAASSVDENDVARAFNGGGAPPEPKPKQQRQQPQTTGGQGFAAIPQGGAPPRPRPTTQAQPPQREGGQRQYIEQPVPVCRSDGLAPVLDWVLEHLDIEHTVSDLAIRARMSDRSFARRFVAETGTTPHKWITLQRVLRAQRLLEDTDMGIDEVAQRSGFGSGALLRHHFRKVVGVSPADFRRTFAARTALAGS